MPDPMHLIVRLCRRYPFSTFRSTVLTPLKEACGICIIALGLLVLFVATVLLDVGSSMVPSELGLKFTVEPTGENGEEASKFGSRENGREGDDEEGEGSREHSGRKGEVHQNAAESSEEDENEEAAQPSPSSMSPPLSDDLSFRRTHTVRCGNELAETHTAMLPSTNLISGRSSQLPVDTVNESGTDRVDAEGEAVNDHSPADSDAAYLDLVRGLIEDELKGGPTKAVTRRQGPDGE